MSTTFSKWLVPAVGFVIGILMSLALIGRNAAPWQVALSFAIVAGYALALRFLQSRSETAGLLSGMPVDERWETINRKSLSNAGQVVAVVLVVAFLWISFTGGDVLPYAWVGAVFAVAYLGSIAWYRIRG